MKDPAGVRTIGVISDTHGLLRPEAIEALREVELIIHAGDIGKAEVLKRLREIAPVCAVRGNIDDGRWARELRQEEIARIGSTAIHVVHDLGRMNIDPFAGGIRVVVYGHSHRPSVEERQGVLFLNPGSAGPKRFRLAVTLAYLRIGGENEARGEIIRLVG